MMSISKQGSRIRGFFNLKAEALQKQFKLIESILPAADREGASHVAEEGRYIESLLRSFLNSVLPKELRVFSGFITRPVTKTDKTNISRKLNDEHDQHSNQLDIIVYDVARYPVFEMVEEFAIVPPEGVVAVFSVKKRLYPGNVRQEIKALNKAVYLCRGCEGIKSIPSDKKTMRSPLTGIVAFTSTYAEEDQYRLSKKIFKEIEESYKNKSYPFDVFVSQVNVLDACCVFKSRPSPANEKVKNAKYISYHYRDDIHNGLQYMLTGILSAYYHPTRNIMSRPGYTCFEPGRPHDIEFKEFNVSGLRCEIDFEL